MWSETAPGHCGGMNETSSFRRAAATLTIGSFSLAALMGIVALLGGGSFGEGEARILLTTLIVGCASICMLCYLATGGTRWAAVGGIGAVVLVLPVMTALVLVWGETSLDSEGLWKGFGVGVVTALTLAQICMLLAATGGREQIGVVLWPTVGLAVLVAVLVAGMILGQEGPDALLRLLGVLAILDVLGTLVTIALARFGVRNAIGSRVAGHSGGLQVTLYGAQATDIADLSRLTARSPSELVAEAVNRYLRAEV
jgi:hypothetical protein